MLKPEYLTSVADSVVELYGEVEREVTADIARRIVKTGRVTETAAWQIERGQQFGLLTTDVTKTLRSSQAMGEKEITRITGEAAEKGLSFDNAIYAKAGINPLTISQSPALQSIVLQGMDDTKKLLGNFTKTLAHDAQRAYISLVDKAFLKTMTGAFDYNTAMRSAIQELVSKGITKISYPSGAAISVEAAVRRNVITGINQSVAKLQLYRAEELGCQLVEVTSHAGARPSHAEWQGKVYCISGKHKHYGDFYRETGYGTGEGLCGWNCYHSFYPFFEGLSTQAFVHDPSDTFLGKSNDEMYEEQQKQRYYERQIRAAKKECEIYSAAMDACDNPQLKADIQNDLLKASNKLRGRESKLNDFLASTGRTKDPTRVYVGGWNRNSMTTSKTRIAKEAREVKSPFVQGKDISSTWTRREGQFSYAIEDAVNAQGFDGLPRVVSEEQFNRAVQESNLFCQRIYSSDSEETLRAYQEALYKGDWYIDCSEGGSMFGRGMYCAFTRGTEETERMAATMHGYCERDRGIVETFTLDKSARTIAYSDLKKITPEGMEPTVYATLKGFSAVTDCGRTNYTIVLNRTACIFKEGAGVKTYEEIEAHRFSYWSKVKK